METGHIKEFVTLAECLSYSEAAERLFISQPSLTKHIQALERELGAALFVRTTRSIRRITGAARAMERMSATAWTEAIP